MLGGGSSTPRYEAPSATDEVHLSHGVERSPSGPGCEIVYDTTIAGKLRARRRYVHFRALHVALKKELDAKSSSFSDQLPECAPSRTMQELARGRSGQATDRVIRQRTMRLEVYLKSVIARFPSSGAVRSFLDASVGAWDDPAGWDASAEADVDGYHDEDEAIDDPEVAASMREQRAALRRAREELELSIAERQALDAANEDGHDPAAAAATHLASELVAAKDAVTCASRHKERLEQLRLVELDRARRASRCDRARLVDAVEAALRDEVAAVERPRALALAKTAEKAEAEADVAASARDVESFRVAEWAPARAKAAEATEKAEATELAATAAERRLADIERREAEVVAASASLRAAADAAARESQMAGKELSDAVQAGSDALREAMKTSMELSAACDERSESARSALVELRLLERLRRAHDASRKEMVAAAATREAARIRDGVLRSLAKRVEIAEVAFRDEHAKAALSVAVMAAEAIYGARCDQLRSAGRRANECREARDRAQAEERAAELAATTAAAAATELVAAARWARAHARAARRAADEAAAERDSAVALASEREAEARTRHAEREEAVVSLRRRALEASVAAEEAHFAVDTRELLLRSGPRFATLADDITPGVFLDQPEDEPLFPPEIVDRLRAFPRIENNQSDDENYDEDDITSQDDSPRLGTTDLDEAVAAAKILLVECESDRDRLAAEHEQAALRVRDERAALDAKIKHAKDRVAAIERAIARLAAYSAVSKEAESPRRSHEEGNHEESLSHG